MVQNPHGLLTDLKYARVKIHLNLGHLLASPQRDQNGRRVLILNARKFLVGYIHCCPSHTDLLIWILFFVGGWDNSVCSLEDAFRAFVYCFQRAIAEEETQTNGIVLILDFKDFTLRQIAQITPSFIRKIAALIQVERTST